MPTACRCLLATDRELWGEVWVTVPLAILIVLLGSGGAFFASHELFFMIAKPFA